MKFPVKFALAVLLQVACLTGMIGYKYISLITGTVVMLEVPRPKDPRSLFSGDYVIIYYAINNIDLKSIENDIGQCDYDKTVYVTLEQHGEIWAPARVSNNKPGGQAIFIKGKIDSCSDNSASISYGIENYFVPENTGMAMEDQLRSVRKARVSIDAAGQGTIVDIPEK